MNPTYVDPLVLALTAALGLVGGWLTCWFFIVRVRRRGEASSARDALASLNRMADLVMSDVRSHKRSMAHIAEELAALHVTEAQGVAEVVQRLVEANQAMEQRLVSAETTLHEQAQQLEAKSSEACTDSLTHLANRRAFNDELMRRFEEFQRLQRPISVILVDVDHFKKLNDSFGHQVGDEILRGIAGMLRQAVRGMDLVARYGGEEFGVVLPNTPLVVATAVAERTREAIAQKEFRYDGRVHQVTVSAGVAELRTSEQVPLLLRRADEALYTSKQRGRNCTHFHDGREMQLCVASAQDRGPELGENKKSSALAAIGSLESSSAPTTTEAESHLVPPAPVSPAASATETISDRNTLERLVRSRLAEWKRGGRQLTIAMVSVNDLDAAIVRLGAEVGELMVQTVGRQLVSAVREMDTVALYMPACFAVVFPRTIHSQSNHVVERIQEYMTDCSVSYQGEKLKLGVSIGFTEAMEGDDVIRLLNRAFDTMEAARQAGGGRPFVHLHNWPEAMKGPGPLNLGNAESAALNPPGLST